MNGNMSVRKYEKPSKYAEYTKYDSRRKKKSLCKKWKKTDKIIKFL